MLVFFPYENHDSHSSCLLVCSFVLGLARMGKAGWQGRRNPSAFATGFSLTPTCLAGTRRAEHRVGLTMIVTFCTAEESSFWVGFL